MITIIKTNTHKLHDYEYVEPIIKILNEEGKNPLVKHYSEITKKELQESKKIIICGTSLQDNRFKEDIKLFEWVKNFSKPLLGICAGMQIIGLIHKGKTKEKTEIGYYHEVFNKEFLGIKGNQEVYHLHNNYIILNEEFEEYTKSKIPQAIKHKEKPTYGALFHPEVRNKEIIRNFIKNE